MADLITDLRDTDIRTAWDRPRATDAQGDEDATDGDADAVDGGDADGTDGGDADTTDGDASDVTDGDADTTDA